MNSLERGFSILSWTYCKGSNKGISKREMSKKDWLELYGKAKVLEYKCLSEEDTTNVLYRVQSLLEDIEKEII